MASTPGEHPAASLPSRWGSGNSYNYSLLDYYGMDGFEVNRNSVATGFDSRHAWNDAVSSDEISVAADADADANAVPPVRPHDGSPEAAGSANTTPDNDNDDPAMLFASGPPPLTTDKSATLASDFDMYGFKKNLTFFESSKASYNEWFSVYADQLAHQRKKWEILMKHNGLSLSSSLLLPMRFPPKSDKVKKLIRKGIPPEWRGDAWFFYAGGYERLHLNPNVYATIVQNTRGVRNKDTEVIERDLNRTFPDNRHFSSHISASDSVVDSSDSTVATPSAEQPLISSLRRVLVAFAHYQPHIGYCQSLNFLAGLLLLFMSEERAFWMLVIMTERIIPKVHSANLEGVHTDQGVLMLCVKEYIPRLWQIIGRNLDGDVLSDDKILARLPPVTLVTSSWFMSVFVGVVPIESVLRIWDILWYEGSKTLFRVSLTMCRLCLDSPSFLADGKRDSVQTEQIELFQFMQSYPKTFTDPNLLVDKCFKKIGGYGYGFLSQDEINKCREFVAHQRSKLKNKAVVTAEMSQQERDALHLNDDADIHDVYGFHKSIMNGVVWNRHLSSRMKQKFRKHR